MPWRAVPRCILHRGCFCIVMLVASGWLPCAGARGLRHGKTVVGAIRQTPRCGTSPFAAFAIRTRRNSAGAVPSGVRSCPEAFPFAWRFQRNCPFAVSPSGTVCDLSRSPLPPVDSAPDQSRQWRTARRIFGSLGQFQGNAPSRVFRYCRGHRRRTGRGVFAFSFRAFAHPDQGRSRSLDTGRLRPTGESFKLENAGLSTIAKNGCG